MRQRRRLQDPSSRPDYSKNPVQITLTWNAAHEVFNYNDQLNNERGDMTNLKFTVLDPSPYRVTGKTDQDERIWSNLCRPFMSEKSNQLVVRMRDTRDYKHTIAKGLWKDIRDEVTKEYKGRWTQALLVVLHGGYKSIWEEGHENTDWEPVEYDRLAFINLRGNAITEGWKHSFADSEFTADNSDFLVMIHLNSDLRYTPGRSRNQKWAQPLFRINDPFDEDGETPLEKYEDNVAIAEQLFWDEWVPYAKEIWEAPNYPTPNPLVEDNPETEEEEEEDQEEYEESRYDRPRDVRPHEHDPEEEYEEEEEEELPPPRRTRSTTTKAKAKAGATKPKRATGPKAKAGATKPKRATGPKAKTGSRRKKVDDLPPPAQQPTRKVDDKLPAPIDPEDLPF